MGEKLGGSASNPMTMIMGGGGAAGGPAGLAKPTPFMPHSTGAGIQQGASAGPQPNPYGIVPPAMARQQQRQQQGKGGPLGAIGGIVGGLPDPLGVGSMLGISKGGGGGGGGKK